MISPTTELQGRLRDAKLYGYVPYSVRLMLGEAATAIEALTTERDRLLAEPRDVAEAVAAERERCAKVARAEMDKCNLYVERKLGGESGIEMNMARYRVAADILAAIREGNHEHDNG